MKGPVEAQGGSRRHLSGGLIRPVRPPIPRDAATHSGGNGLLGGGDATDDDWPDGTLERLDGDSRAVAARARGPQ